jgi:D-alanyl-D-alanine carboxypeptidase
MTSRQPARNTTRRIPRILVAGLLVVIAAIAASLGYPRLLTASSPPAVSPSLPASSSSSSASRIPILRSGAPGALGGDEGVIPDGGLVLRPGQRGVLGEADGVVPDGTTAFDDEIPGIANLDPDLLGALRRAATDAAGDEVEMFVTSGWRSRTYQEQLFRQAISKYGSKEKAAHWVAPPGTSAHESGKAVDIGSSDAVAWMSKHGAAYGLCQIYRNEPWHYELRPGAINRGCPRMDADPTRDPRMQP